MSSSNCCFLTCRQLSQEAGQVVWYSHLFQNFPQLIVIHTVKGFGIVNKAEIDVFLELSCFFHDPVDVGNFISGSSAFSKTSLNIRICHVKRWAAYITSWTQDCWEKYQQPQICRWYHPNGRKWRGTEEPFDEDKRGEWKSWLKTQHSKNEDHGIWFHHFIANKRGKSGNSDRFYFLQLQNTVGGDCSHEIKTGLLLGRKAMTNLDSVLKSRDITLLTKVHIVKAMVSPVVVWGCEIWTIKKAECLKIVAFELRC